MFYRGVFHQNAATRHCVRNVYFLATIFYLPSILPYTCLPAV